MHDKLLKTGNAPDPQSITINTLEHGPDDENLK